jgi:hypothetical protein
MLYPVLISKYLLRSLPICPPSFVEEYKLQRCSSYTSLHLPVPNLTTDPRAGVDAVEKRNLLPLLGIESKFLGRLTPSVVPTPTELSQIDMGRAG